MKHFFILLFLALPIMAQMTTRPVDLPKIVETGPAFVPTAATAVTTTTTWLYEVTLTNTSASDLVCTIKDRQITPMQLLAADAVIKAGAHWILTYPNGRKMLSGISWNCGSANAVVGTLVGRQQ